MSHDPGFYPRPIFPLFPDGEILLKKLLGFSVVPTLEKPLPEEYLKNVVRESRMGCYRKCLERYVRFSNILKLLSDDLSRLDFPQEDKATGNAFRRGDSFRKVLPSKPSSTVDSRLSMSMKMIERPFAVDPNNQNIKMFMPFMLEYALMAEYIMLQKQDLTGIYVIPSDQDPLIWFGVIFVKQGLYQGGIFRFQLHFPENFPDGPCPKVIFESRVYHPAINMDTGELNVSEEFKEWKRKVNHVWQVLQYVRRIFYTIDAKATDNLEAAKLFNEDNQKFRTLAQGCVEESRNKLYDPPTNQDLNYLNFHVNNVTISDSFLEDLLNSIKE